MALDDLTKDFAVYGEALADFGLCVRDAIDGMGIATRGLIWHCPQIWIDVNLASPLTTGYTGSALGASLLTTWTTSTLGASLGTGWSAAIQGTWGEC